MVVILAVPTWPWSRTVFLANSVFLNNSKAGSREMDAVISGGIFLFVVSLLCRASSTPTFSCFIVSLMVMLCSVVR